MDLDGNSVYLRRALGLGELGLKPTDTRDAFFDLSTLPVEVRLRVDRLVAHLSSVCLDPCGPREITRHLRPFQGEAIRRLRVPLVTRRAKARRAFERALGVCQCLGRDGRRGLVALHLRDEGLGCAVVVDALREGGRRRDCA
jgi:hypothetical protein